MKNMVGIKQITINDKRAEASGQECLLLSVYCSNVIGRNI